MFSGLATYYNPSPTYYNGRDTVDTVTIHHMAGNMLARNCADWFATSERKCSANYLIGTDGEIACGLDEEKAPCTSSNRANDLRAITIEVANDGGAADGWHVSDKAIKSLIALLVDICQRHPAIGRLRWVGDPDLAGQVDKQNITLHKWFSATGCPGEYLESQIPAIVRRVNSELDRIVETPQEEKEYTLKDVVEKLEDIKEMLAK